MRPQRLSADYPVLTWLALWCTLTPFTDGERVTSLSMIEVREAFSPVPRYAHETCPG